jgi:hypothetical protein
VAGSSIAYVDNRGMTISACVASHPTPNGNAPASAYCDIADAVAAIGSKTYIVVTGHGTAYPYSPLALSGTLTIVGPGFGTNVTSAVVAGTASGALVAITNAGSAPGVTIDGLEITSNHLNSGGVSCNATATAGHALRLRRVFVHDNQNDAITNSNCDMTIEDSKVSGSDQHAVSDSNGIEPTYVIQRSIFTVGSADGLNLNGNLTFDRNIVANYTNGDGLEVNFAHPFRITNSFFYLCARGLHFNSTSAAEQIFQFNTVVYNGTAAINGGCPAQMAVTGSIFLHNGDAPNSLSGCNVLDVVTEPVAGDAGPAFVNDQDPANYDFHLAIDTQPHTAANTACCIDKMAATIDAGAPLSTQDFDGTKRPQGNGYDIGADEAK